MLCNPGNTLNLSGCEQLANVDGLQGLGGLTALQSLTLNLGRCSQLASVDVLRCLADLTALQSLTLDLSDCKQLADLGRRFDSKADFLAALGVEQRPR